MGGWGGSVLAMIQSLKNNKMLLRGRSSFFRKGMSYTEIRQHYKDSLSPIPDGKKPTKEQLESIGKRLRKEQKDSKFYAICISITVALCMLVFIDYSYNNFIHIKSILINKNKPNTKIIELQKARSFEEKLERGMAQFDNKKYFLAIGNFKHALRYNQTDSLTNTYLARAYYRMCRYKNQTCNEAILHAQKMLEANPESSIYRRLTEYYSKINN